MRVKELIKEEKDLTSMIGTESTFDFEAALRQMVTYKGYFMLWRLSVSSDSQGQRIIPIFINQDFILRPMAGKKIWDAILDTSSIVTVYEGDKIDTDTRNKLRIASQEFAYDSFLALKAEIEKRNEETHRKYLYALNLRFEAAQHIGIENIRQHKLLALGREKAVMEANYQAGKILCPDFKLVMLAHME